MAATLAVQLTLQIAWQYRNTLDLSTPADIGSVDWSDTLATGTGLDLADMIFCDTRTLTATSESIDLAGVLVNSLTGATMTFARIKFIGIRNKATTAGYTLAVGGAASNAFINWVANSSDIVNVGPDGKLLLHNPSLAAYAVTAATGDLLKIDAGANTITYDIIIIGASA